jgi:hypothetical protein
MNAFFLWDFFKTIAFSLLMIFLIHHVWTIILDNTTNKSTKSLIDSQTEKYKKIIDDLTRQCREEAPYTQVSSSDPINETEKQMMIDELNRMVTSHSGTHGNDVVLREI